MEQVSGVEAGVVAGVRADQPDVEPGPSPLAPRRAACGDRPRGTDVARTRRRRSGTPQAAAGHLGEVQIAELGLRAVEDPRGRQAVEIGRPAPLDAVRRAGPGLEAGHPAAVRRAGVGVLDVVGPGTYAPGSRASSSSREARPAAPARAQPQERLDQHLRLAHQDDVQERRDRLGVDLEGDPAGHHQRVAVVAVGGAQRQAGAVEDGQQVGVVGPRTRARTPPRRSRRRRVPTHRGGPRRPPAGRLARRPPPRRR